jgi:hypothetical protein
LLKQLTLVEEVQKETKYDQGKNLTKVEVNKYQEPRESFSLLGA